MPPSGISTAATSVSKEDVAWLILPTNLSKAEAVDLITPHSKQPSVAILDLKPQDMAYKLEEYFDKPNAIAERDSD